MLYIVGLVDRQNRVATKSIIGTQTFGEKRYGKLSVLVHVNEAASL